MDTFLVRLTPVLREPFKRSQRGLFHGKQRLTGNNVSFSNRKTRRVWLPNVQTKRLYSDILERTIKFNVTTHALKCIDKAGGLDNYLLHTKPAKLDSPVALEYRAILQEILATREPAAAPAAPAPK